jgi:amino acid transporter
MLLAVSRLMFAWADDGIFPAPVAAIHPRFRTPHVAIAASGVMATLGILGSHLAGDFFLGVDILVTSMLVNFLLMAISVLTLPSRNPELARAITVVPSRTMQVPLGIVSAIVLAGFLLVHTWKDLHAPVAAWYFRSTYLWAIVVTIGSVIYWREVQALEGRGVDLRARMRALPRE